MMCYMVKQLAENLTTHVQTHAEDCAKNWLNNKLRAKLTDDDYSSKYHWGHIGRLEKEPSSNESLSEIPAAHSSPVFRGPYGSVLVDGNPLSCRCQSNMTDPNPNPNPNPNPKSNPNPNPNQCAISRPQVEADSNLGNKMST